MVGDRQTLTLTSTGRSPALCAVASDLDFGSKRLTGSGSVSVLVEVIVICRSLESVLVLNVWLSNFSLVLAKRSDSVCLSFAAPPEICSSRLTATSTDGAVPVVIAMEVRSVIATDWMISTRTCPDHSVCHLVLVHPARMCRCLSEAAGLGTAIVCGMAAILNLSEVSNRSFVNRSRVHHARLGLDRGHVQLVLADG
jgi:hypothetical protein